jgi:hypothetical protein
MSVSPFDELGVFDCSDESKSFTWGPVSNRQLPFAGVGSPFQTILTAGPAPETRDAASVDNRMRCSRVAAAGRNGAQP